MKTAYFGISLSNRPKFDKEIETLKSELSLHGISLLVFVDQFSFGIGQEKEMMQCAFSEIERSDFLIVELSKKAIGVGVEVGYAFAKKKPIIYLKKKEANYSTTVGGCTDYLIEYESPADLKNQLHRLLKENTF